jgi:hypothetical protein
MIDKSPGDDSSEINQSDFVRSLMWLDKHARLWTLTHPRVLHAVCSRGIGFQPVTVFMTLVRRCSWFPSFCCSSRTGWKPFYTPQVI